MNRKARRANHSSAVQEPHNLQQSVALYQAGKFAEAMHICEAILKAQPNQFDALYLSAAIAVKFLNYPQALELLDKAIRVNPDSAEAYSNRGFILQQLHQWESALSSYDKAIVIKSSYAEAHYNRGAVLYELRQYAQALASYDRAIAGNPHYVVAYFNRGVALYELGRYSDALTSYDKAIALKPDYAEAYVNRGNVLYVLKRYEEAFASYGKAVTLKPDYAEAYYNLGFFLREMKHHNDALTTYDRALAINPEFADAYLGKSFTKLALGQYEEGWNLHEWRWKSVDMKYATPQNFSKPLWLGKESIAGKTVLLYAEQGLGDMLQFCRYAPMVEALGAKVLLAVPSSLMGVMSTLKGAIQIIEQGKPLPEFDFHCPLMSLPLAFGTTVETIPSKPYLCAQQEYIEKWKPILDEQLGTLSLRIGLCWAGGIRRENSRAVIMDAKRSLHFNVLKPLLDVENSSFVSLQLGPPKEQLDDARVHDISSQIHNWSDTAAVILLLDLVITVDTSVCHLAGAMGKKTWLLNRYDTCWRWLLDRDDSPWYPSLTQFRQKTPGDWDEVVARVKAELEVL